MKNSADSSSRRIGRRGLIIGSTATALATGLALSPSVAAAAPPGGGGSGSDGTAPNKPGGNSPNAVHPDTSPVTTTLASAPISGYVYRTVDMYDFRPFLPGGQVTWSPSGGVYTAGTATVLRASIEIPAGALIKDVEYYIYNKSTTTWGADAYLYVPGQAYLSSIGASVSIPSTGTVAAYRAVAGYQGPFPLGSRLLVSCSTPTTGLVLVNGARVGFSQGAGTLGQLPAPIRAYDSRLTGGKFAVNTVRTITLPTTVYWPGVSAVSINVISLNSTAKGLVKVYSADASEPNTVVLYFRPDGFPWTNQIVTTVSSTRQVKVKVTAPTDIILDVVGIVG